MPAKQIEVELLDVQKAIFAVALSLDAFLLNGIQYGVLQRAVFGDFLQQTIAILRRDLSMLEEIASHAAGESHEKANDALAALRAKLEPLIGLVSELGSFENRPLPQVHAAIAKIPLLRAECVELVQELEDEFQTPTRFYSSRPAHSAASVTGFLAGLNKAFTEEWSGCSGRQERDVP